jgi:hypothetical protein
MTEAIALLGVAAAAIQCAQAGGQLLLLGASLRSKLQDAPDKVKKWLAHIEQLVALAELMNQSGVNLLPSSVPPLAPPSSSTSLVAPWVKTALLDCTSQAQALQTILREMLHEVDDRKGQKIWKTILTVTRETKIISILHEIERQKSMLNMWLGQNNLRQLDKLQHTVQDVRGGVEKVDQYMVHVQQAFREEIQNLARTVQASSTAAESSIEHLKSLGKSSVESLKEEIQNQYDELRVESSATQLQLQDLVSICDYVYRYVLTIRFPKKREMNSIKHEFRKMMVFQTQVSRSPSLLKEALDNQNSQTLRLNTGSKLKRSLEQSSTRVPQECSCRPTSRVGSWGLGRNIRVTVVHRNTRVERCPVHKNADNYFVAFRCRMQTAMLANLLKLNFEATHSAGGFSMGMLLRTYRRVRNHSLEPFFRDLYRQSQKRSRPFPYDEKAQDILFRIAQKEIWRAFNSGAASINDVDRNGRGLIHVSIILMSFDCL